MPRVGNWLDVLDRDFPDTGPITKEIVAETQRLSGKHRGSMRISTGRIWTDDEYNRRRDEVKKTPLP